MEKNNSIKLNNLIRILVYQAGKCQFEGIK